MSESTRIKILTADLLDNLDAQKTEQDKLDYLADNLAVAALMINKIFGADIAILQIDIIKASIKK